MLIKELLTIFESDQQHAQTLKTTGFWGKQGAGCLIMARNTGRFCLAHRSAYVEQPGTWGTWGGAIDNSETPESAAQREIQEETGYGGAVELTPLYVFSHPNGFRFYNFLAIVETEFQPKLDWGNQGYVWTEWGNWPKPMHFGLQSLVNDPASVETIKKHMPDTTVSETTLTEGGTAVLYHYTGINAALKILKSQQFQLSSSTGVHSEQKYAPRGHPYFMSTSRSRVGDYHRWARSAGVMFVLDGQWLSQRYPIKPIDYWEQSWARLGSDRASESEDRVFSKTNSIPISPVKQIHVLLSEQNEYLSPRVREILIICKKINMPCYLYTNSEAWRLQDTRRALTVSQAKHVLGGFEPRRTTRRPYEYLSRWIELIEKNNKKYLSKDANELRFRLVTSGRSYRHEDMGLKTDMHNARKPDGPDYENSIRINQYMRKSGITTLLDLKNQLVDKWEAISNQPQNS
jgi:8-oxo-dGTP pyrophosphatase MutT (NUDIX family)